MCRRAPASWPTPIPSRSNRSASTRRRRCSVPPKKPSGLQAPPDEGSRCHMNSQADHEHAPKWKHDGVRVIPASSLDPNTAQTPGMDRKAAINYARVGAQKIWAGTVSIEPNARTGAHHHGELESVIYVLRGRARMRWGEQLEYTADAGPGDFIYVPPYVPHQEINALADQSLECVLVRSGQDPIVVNLDIPVKEPPEEV